MAKIGYMLLAPGYCDAEADEKWMTDFGCAEIVKEKERAVVSKVATHKLDRNKTIAATPKDLSVRAIRKRRNEL